MWKNYLVASFRSLRRNKRFASLNILGLAVGLAACLLMTAYVIHELSFDRSHVRADRIYRVNGNVPYGDRTLRNAEAAGPLGPAVKEAVPEVEDSVRLLRLTDIPVQIDGREFKEARAFAAEPSVFDVFTIPFRRGDPKTALAAPFTVVLEESLGRKYFGEADPVGRTIRLRIGENHDFLVTGIIRDLPSNTVLKRPMFVSFATFERLRGESLQRWANWGSVQTFVLLHPGGEPASVAANITAAAAPHLEDDSGGKKMTYALQPLRDIYLDTLNNDLDNSGSMSRVTVFAVIAGLMLLVAAINFINLSTAKVAGRMKEVGVRKTCGAGRTSLVGMFLVESTLLTAVAMSIGIGFFELFKPRLEAYLGKALSLGIWTTPGMLPAVVLAVLVVGLLAGSYPAFYLSRFPATAMFRPGLSSRTSKFGLRRVLVVSQFVIAIALMASTAVVIKQVRYAENKDLGFDQSRLVVLRNDSARDRKNASLLKREILARTVALSAGSIAWLPSDQSRNISRFSAIYPVVAYPAEEDASELVIRLPPGRTAEAVREIRSVWNELMPGQSFDLEFVDEVLVRAYVEDQRLAVLLVSFCILMIFVACLGIFGLASYSAEQRTKEIGIRKVLGASVPSLILLLARNYSRWVLWANLFAWPAAYFAARAWLADYAYRTSLSLGPFILAGILALAIALLSVLFQTFKAARSQPIESLRYE